MLKVLTPESLVTVGLEASVMVAPLLFVTVIVPECALVPPVTRDGVGPENAKVTAPVPVSVTDAGVTVAPVYATVNDPLKAVAAVGENRTLTVQEAPVANVPVQFGALPGNAPVVTREKAPTKVKLPPFKATLPVLVTVTFCVVLLLPVTQVPKLSEPGVTLALRFRTDAVSIAPISYGGVLGFPKKSVAGGATLDTAIELPLLIAEEPVAGA